MTTPKDPRTPHPKDPRMTPPKDPHKVPQVLKDLSEATKRDIAPAIKLMSRIFVGTILGGEQSFVREVVSAAAAPSPQPVVRPVQKKEQPTPKKSSQISRGAIVIDAEIVSEECGTCGGTHKVGRPGYEIPCPRCRASQR